VRSEPGQYMTGYAVNDDGTVAMPTTATCERNCLMDWKLELVAIPVSDVDRAKAFYVEKAGFNADHDHRVGDEIRFVQLTPPGSACSIALGTGLIDTPPGSVQGMQMVVSDIEAARAALVERGVDVSEVQKFDWGWFVFFQDPDGNGWALQQIPPRA
jgi:predicted enzyme related to lactoylglutathione lyase